MSSTIEETIFKQRSSTFYPSARLFPAALRDDVSRLYGFVRVADDYIDERPQQPEQFIDLWDKWRQAIEHPNFDTTFTQNLSRISSSGSKSPSFGSNLPIARQHSHNYASSQRTNLTSKLENFDLEERSWIGSKTDELHERLVKNMVRLSKTYGFDPEWIESFFAAMQMDLDGRTYKTLDDSLEYVYGSAEVVGLMMAKMMRLPDEALIYARLQGRAMQWINFIRDLDEDTRLGRCYFPGEDLKHFGLSDLRRSSITQRSEEFCAFIRYQLTRYDEWQAEAEQGFRFLPSQSRRALKAATDAYNEIAVAIAKDPMLVNSGGRSA